MNALRLAAGAVALTAAVAVTAAPAMGNIVGTAGDDSIRGGPGGNWIVGRAGDDRIWGGRGSDFIHGSSGDDRLVGGPNLDFLNGWEGDDRLYFGNGMDYGMGMDGNDRLRGGSGDDRPLQGGPGRDRIWGGSGDDRLLGQQDRDLIWPGPGVDESHTGGAADRVLLRVDGASDHVNCGTGDDAVTYSGQRDAADTLTACERVWTNVTTPGWVTGDEWARADVGMRKARVHRIFESGGRLLIQRTPDDFGRLYRQCRPGGPRWECRAELEYLVDGDGVPRLVGKIWASICGSV
jgi:Ca2+-binding RTX toxin-like protein